ncbi:DUF5615 family PIN-like protein [Nitrospira sp.]|uniref:DUF5615 family PIN-like protein n=2 Tax=unclassified Nitrospira TaxID=2652172 RepID=UPI003FCE62F8
MDGSIVSLLPGAGKSIQIDSKSTIPLRDVFPTPMNGTMVQCFAYETIRRLIEQPEQVTGCVLAYYDSGTIQPIPLHAVAPKPFDWDAVHIRERELQESEDEVILDRAARKDRMLVSAATYFETVFVPCITRKNPPVILLRQLDSERVTVS